LRRILILGANGQVGTELLLALEKCSSVDAVFPTDIVDPKGDHHPNYFKLDVTSYSEIRQEIVVHGITDVYLMAAILSAPGEKNPLRAWQLNMDGLFNVLEIAKDGLIEKVFWPSSIAVFGNNSIKKTTPQFDVKEPDSVYGISKVSGELWCNYYHDKYGVDVRSVRYPGLIGSKSMPGGGTTDYAVHIFYAALNKGSYSCFLSEDRVLPMMHMEDAVRATIELMEAPKSSITIRSSYNIAGMSFDPRTLAEEIVKYMPEFRVEYAIDNRDAIASNWPESIDDSIAKTDWNWKPQYDLKTLVKEMLENIKISSTP
jgi:nucleoside-diphosphate-sugar epimerase